MKNFSLHFTTLLALVSYGAPAKVFDIRGQLLQPGAAELNYGGLENVDPKRVRSPDPSAFKVFLDAGHGGTDLGAPGVYGVLEKNVVLEIAQLMEAAFPGGVAGRRLDIRTSRVRDLAVPLRSRAAMANAWGADVFVSIHANSSPFAHVKGFEVYFLSQDATDSDAHVLAQFENAMKRNTVSTGVLSILSDLTTTIRVGESSAFAETVYRSMEERLRANKRGVRQAPFTVLAETEMPALLVEVGYLTNRTEAKRLEKRGYLSRVARAINSGVIRFLSNKRNTL